MDWPLPDRPDVRWLTDCQFVSPRLNGHVTGSRGCVVLQYRELAAGRESGELDDENGQAQLGPPDVNSLSAVAHRRQVATT